VEIRKLDTDGASHWKGDKKSAKEELVQIRKKLVHLQQLLYAEDKHKLLIVLQAMDSGGKDGAIRSIFEGVNPQGVKVASFKVPTPIELSHDYLWRVHAKTPGRGEIVIFNRSHYEDVLVVRVHGLAPEKVWRKRFQHINDFEKMLADEGTTILKFFLNISKEEQKQRFLERIEDPEKQWKFNPGDIEERKSWDRYMAAYEDVLNSTSTKWAPWYAIPSDRNWFRDLVISGVIADTLEKMDMQYPAPVEDIDQYKDLLV
jgi:PPK2 family polyphosphate:nucleotide phosphotransferase